MATGVPKLNKATGVVPYLGRKMPQLIIKLSFFVKIEKGGEPEAEETAQASDDKTPNGLGWELRHSVQKLSHKQNNNRISLTPTHTLVKQQSRTVNI
jgi:hypothetical protein